MAHSVERLVSRDRILQAKTLAAMLVKNGMINPAAIEDPERYDNWRTWNAILDVASEITKAANKQVSDGGPLTPESKPNANPPFAGPTR